MRYDDYVIARRSRLVEHAVDLGCDAGAAPGVVDRVLAQQRGRIERTADPDPTTYAALERALAPPRARPRPALVALVVAALVLPLGAWWVLRPGPTTVVPSLYGLESPDLLRDAGLGFDPEPVAGCEPAGLALGTDPAAGTRVEEGTVVRLQVAGAPDPACADRADRAAAWQFVGFVRGGPAPDLDDTVYVVLDGREPAVLPRAAVLDPQRWAGIRSLARDLDALTRDASAYPVLVSETLVPPETRCGTPRPGGAGDRPVLRLAFEPRDTLDGSDGQEAGCPLTVDLYRDRSGVIDAVVVYSAAGAAGVAGAAG